MRVQIVCGFLGAGKTTLLKHLVDNAGTDTAILVNEFGEIGIDGTLLSEGTKIAVRELPSGCICCSLREELVLGVKEIMESFKPKRLIIEPSGIAMASQIILGLKEADFSAQLTFEPVIGVLDSTVLLELIEEDALGNFFLDQITNSDILLLNKSDLVSNQVIQKCKEAVTKINPSALIIPSVFCNIKIPEIEARNVVKRLHYSPNFKAEAFSVGGIIPKENLEKILARLKEGSFGKIYRAKGIVNIGESIKTFDFVHGLIDYGEIKEASTNKLVFIGKDIDRPEIEKLIKEVVAIGN